MAAAHYGIDLAPVRPRAGAWGRGLLALGVIAVLVAGLGLRERLVERAAIEDTLVRLEGALASRGAADRAAAAKLPGAAERRLQADAARVSGDLHRPWPALFEALEASASPRVNVQQLGVDSGFAKLQLQVDAPGLPELLQYVQALDQAGAPLQGAQLLGHEWVANGGARRLQARIAVGLVARMPIRERSLAGGPGLASGLRKPS